MIKKIVPLSDDKKRVLVVFDDDQTVAVLINAVKEFCWKEGDNVEASRILEIARLAEEKLAFEKAVDCIGRSMKSQKEMRNYLKEKGFSWAVACSVVDKLVDYGYLDDNTYTEAYLNHYGKTRGRKKLLYELTATKGIERSVAEDAIANQFDEDTEIAKAARLGEVYAKKNRKKEGLKQKTYASLAAKGFEGDIISSALDIIFGEEF